MMKLQDVISGILQREGSKYTNNPNDSGGPTKYGITQATLARYRRRAVTPQEVQNLTEAEARKIYEQLYWYDPGLDKVNALSPKIAEELLDTGVNTGSGRAATFFQRALNGLNNGGKNWPDIAEDGAIGPRTIACYQAFVKQRGAANAEKVMFRYLNGLQLAFYDDLIRRRPKDEEFMYGWVLNRVE
ncbi:endolysin N-acetylmuramidase [Stenotrophomonas phage Summit]|nr:endolysin N-acetylmuramidase [Stenotrophomonas phage Summit]